MGKLNNNGFVLISTCWLIALISTLALGGLVLCLNEYSVVQDHLRATQAYYLAEAGLEEGLNLLLHNPVAEVNLDQNVETGSIRVKQEGQFPNRISLKSTGCIGKIKRQLTLQFDFNIFKKTYPVLIFNDDWHYYSEEQLIEIEKNIFCSGNLIVGKNHILLGNVYALGSLEITANALFAGDLYCCSDFCLSEEAKVEGNIYLRANQKAELDQTAVLDGEILIWNGQVPIKIIDFQ